AGEATGILQEQGATDLVAKVIERRDPEMNRTLIRRIIPKLQRLGITTIHDIEGQESLSIFREMRDEGTLDVRVELILPRQMLPQLQIQGIKNEANDLLRVNGIKIFADGTLGSQTAAMLDSFEGGPGNFGILTLPENEMMATVRDAAAMGLTIAI